MALRIEKLRFNSWGCFENHEIELSGLGKVDLIYGENATGKSTTGRGMRSLLFGIEGRTADDHTYPYSELRIGADLLIDGEPVELSRVKRPSAPLLALDGHPILEDPIPAGLGGLGEDVYRALFHVDQETLEEGAAALLGGGGEVGQSLFAAAGGIRSLHETLAALDAEALESFNPPRGRKGALEISKRELVECERRLRAATLKPQRHAKLRGELSGAEQTASEIAAEIREIEARMRATERRRTIAPLLFTHARLAEELAPISATPALPPDAPAQRSAAQARLAAGETQLAAARQDLEGLEEDLDSTEADEALIASAEAISAAVGEVSAVAKAAKDRRKLEGELHSADASLAAAARTAGVPADQVTSAPPSPAAGKALDVAVSGFEEISARVAGAGTRLTKAEKDRDRAREALEKHPAARDLGTLEAALGAAQGTAAVADQGATLEADGEAKAAAAERAFAKLVPRPSGLAGLHDIDLPSAEQAEQAAAELAELAELSRALDGEEMGLATRAAELAEEGDRLGAEGEALTVDDLVEARERRQQAWDPIRSGGEAGDRLEPEVAESFEAAIGAADQLADRRADASERLGRLASHAAARKRHEHEERKTKAARDQLRTREESASAAWLELWQKSGLEPLGAASAPAWLAAREGVLDLDADAQMLTGQAATARDREAAHAGSLREELAAVGEDCRESLTLPGLCARAAKLLAAERERASVRVGLEMQVRTSEAALADAAEEQLLADTALAAWKESWPARLKGAGLPEGTGPADAQELLRALREAAGHREEIENLTRRIAGIDTDRERFAAGVAELCERLAPEFAGLDPESAATSLHGRLAEHEKGAERLANLRERRQGAEKAIAAAEGEITGAQASLAALLEAAGVKEQAELPEVEQRSGHVRTLKAELAELERQVVEAGEDSFEALLAEGEGFDRDAAAAELAQLRERVEELGEERDRKREEILTRRQELEGLETDTEAACAREDVEMALSRVEAAAIAYARARLSATAVRRATERYRRENEGPMLNRTRELFRSFTRKTFGDLYVEVEENGKAVLVGRQQDKALKRVDEMSKGTREQLYLALRIAAIERYVETTGAVPVTFDDVFSESDEPRSERIFEALGELAARTQVTVLTHHRHLIDLGTGVLGERLVVQELPGVAPSLRVAEAA